MRTTTLVLLLAILAITIHAVKVNNKAGFLRSASISINGYFSQTLTSGQSYVIKNFNTNNYLTMEGSSSGFKIAPSSGSGTNFEYTENSGGTGYLTTYTFTECVWGNGTNAGLGLCVLNTNYVQYAGCANYGTGYYDVCTQVKINIINSGVESGNSAYYGDFYLQVHDDGSGAYLQEWSNTYSPSTTRNQK